MKYCEDHSDAVASEPDVLQKLNAIRTSRSRKSVKPSQCNDNNDETIESEIDESSTEDSEKEKNQSNNVKKSHRNSLLPRPPPVLSSN